MSIDTVWFTRCPVPTAFAIAVKLGWLAEEFERHGTALRSLATSKEDSVRQSHFAHTQANSLRHGGGIPPLISRSRGGDLRVVGLSLSWSPQRVLALPGSGIRSAKDLAGRRLSIPRRINDSIDFWRATVLRGFDRALAQAGLSFGDVTQVDLPIGRRFIDDSTSGTGRADMLWDASFMLGFQRDEVAALVRGEVDAIFTQGSTSAALEGFLAATVVTEISPSDNPSDYVNNQPFTLTISGALADEQPELAQRLIARVRDAAQWAADHEREAKRIIAAEAGIPEELVDRSFSPNVHRELDIDLSPTKVAAYQTLHDDLLARNFLEAPVDLDTFIDRRPLREAAALLESGVGAAA
jgi:ABC-type nitrate/sulfonate/bicarbonate transport system substrate-binding protein